MYRIDEHLPWSFRFAAVIGGVTGITLLITGWFYFNSPRRYLPSLLVQPTVIAQPVVAEGVESPVCGTWNTVTALDIGDGITQVDIGGITGSSNSDIWIVGSGHDGKETARLLFVHWDGTRLNYVPGPALDTEAVFLNSVASVSPNDIWSVGSDDGRALIVHWNGSEWVVDPGLPLDIYASELNDIAVVDEDDIWAVGFQHPENREPLIVHWNGLLWSKVAAPLASADAKLYSLAAVSSDDIWAVGYEGAEGAERPLTIHWDGLRWSAVPNSAACEGSGSLVSTSANGPKDIWAVGNCNGSAGGLAYRPLIMHWDGKKWNSSSEESSNLSEDRYLAQVSGVTSDDVWSVGFRGQLRSSGQALVEHWDGADWKVVPFNKSAAQVESLTAVKPVSPNDIWAVGKSDDYMMLAHFMRTSCDIKNPVTESRP